MGKARTAARTSTAKKRSTPTVQHEKGKADVIASGPGTARQVPAGTAEHELGMPEPINKEQRPAFINGQPATVEEVEASTA